MPVRRRLRWDRIEPNDRKICYWGSCGTVGLAERAERTRMTLILRAMKKHMGWDDAKDDYVILDGERSVGRIYKEHGEARWSWSVNTSPFPAPPSNNGLAKSLEEAKQQFKERYEEMKAQGVRPFSDG
jgi:hypothetical protein